MITTWIVQFHWLDKEIVQDVVRLKESRQHVKFYLRATLMKVEDILRNLLFQIKTIIATWIVQFHWLDKK